MPYQKTEEINMVRLGALLHDIGKFWQRCQGKIEKDHESYGEEACAILELEQSIGTIVKGHGKDYWKKINDQTLREIAITVKNADHLSAMEREKEETDEFKSIHRRLISIFNQIDIGKKYVKSMPSIYDTFGPFQLESNVLFPSPTPDSEINRYKLYREIWDKFSTEFKYINRSDAKSFFETIYYLLQKYMILIPSAPAVAKPDVSLFDHLKTTCAIADCLYKMSKTEIQEFLLVGGDISGVQKFIYSITAKGAAKSLRGRSFYLQLLTETVAKYILRRLDLSTANLLYCGGGHFFILAPGNNDKDLEEIHKDITEKLLESHRGELYLVLDWILLSGDDFERKEFGKKWDEIAWKLKEKKKSKFAEVLDKKYSDIFGPIGKGGKEDTCKICGSEEYVEEDEEGEKKCRLCRSFENLADAIVKSKYIVEIVGGKEKGMIEKGSWEDALLKFNVQYDLTFREEHNRTEADQITIYKLNDTNFMDNTLINARSPVSYGFKFLTTQTPITDSKIKNFDKLADDSNGIKRWAVLRMDVDYLGKIFSEGLGEDRTISRISTLSSMISLFFSGWVEKICECKEYKKKVYAIYSGGDDLFIVGSWSVIPNIAMDIRRDFDKFTCRNPNITLSCGISIAPNKKYPLYKIAYSAGEALESSKAVDGKDAITFLGESMKWEDFERITKLKDNLHSLLDSKLHRGLLQTIYSIYREFNRQQKRGGTALAKYDDRYGRWRWLLAYITARMKEQCEMRREELEELRKDISNNIEYSHVASRWTEFLTRKEEG